MSSCLPISTISMQLGRVAVEVDHVAGLFGRLGAGVHGHARRRPGPGRGRRWCRRRSWPPGCRRPARARMRAILSSGVASAMKSSTPASAGDGRGGERVVAGDHDRPDAHGPHLGELGRDAGLDGVLEVDDAEDRRCPRPPPAGCRRWWRCRSTMGARSAGTVPALLLDPALHRVGRALADRAALPLDAATCGSGR